MQISATVTGGNLLALGLLNRFICANRISTFLRPPLYLDLVRRLRAGALSAEGQQIAVVGIITPRAANSRRRTKSSAGWRRPPVSCRWSNSRSPRNATEEGHLLTEEEPWDELKLAVDVANDKLGGGALSTRRVVPPVWLGFAHVLLQRLAVRIP
jgi:hypothetical protein